MKEYRNLVTAALSPGNHHFSYRNSFFKSPKNYIFHHGKRFYVNASKESDPSFTPFTLKDLTIKGIQPSIEKDSIDRKPPRLEFGLDRVLFNPGVHFLKDPRTNVYNFDPYLERIPQISQFDFKLLNKFITAAEDSHLQGIARNIGCTSVSSTSSMSPLLAMITLLILENRDPHLYFLSSEFSEERLGFTNLSKGPVGVIITNHDGIYSIVIEKSSERSGNILLDIGNILEKFITLDKNNFAGLLHGFDHPYHPSDEVYHYLQADKMLLRSQLDCRDPRLPMPHFDLKSRATLPIRQDIFNYDKYLGYHIKGLYGLYESFEREQYDIVRSSLLKYYFQVRIGEMDGLFFTYHNTQRIFGFEYMPREKIEKVLFRDSYFADSCFNYSLQVVNMLINNLIKSHGLQDRPGEAIRASLVLNDAYEAMHIFSEDLPKNYIDDIDLPIDYQKFTADQVSNLKHTTYSCASFVNNSQPNNKDVFVNSSVDSWKLFIQEERTPNPSLSRYISIRKKLRFKSSFAFSDASTELVPGDVPENIKTETDLDDLYPALKEDTAAPEKTDERRPRSNPIIQNVIRNYLTGDVDLTDADVASPKRIGWWTTSYPSSESLKDADIETLTPSIPFVQFKGKYPISTSKKSTRSGGNKKKVDQKKLKNTGTSPRNSPSTATKGKPSDNTSGHHHHSSNVGSHLEKLKSIVSKEERKKESKKSQGSHISHPVKKSTLVQPQKLKDLIDAL